MAGVVSRVNVDFREADQLGGSTFVIEQSARPSDPGKAYFRVHPSSTGIHISSTTGTVNKSIGGLTKRVDQFMSFSDSNMVPLQYPTPTTLQIELIGKFITRTGATVYPKFKYDAVRRAIVSDISGYGTIRVKYQAPYDLWKANFTKSGSGGAVLVDPNRTVSFLSGGQMFYGGTGTPDNDDDPAIAAGYLPLVVIGVKGDGDEVQTASLNPTPDADDDQSHYVGLYNSGARLPRMRLEIDPQYPPRFSKGGQSLSASCRVRLYPNVSGAKLAITSGKADETGTYDGISVKEAVSFNGSASASLGYQPMSSPALSVLTGRFVDRWGKTFTPHLVGPGKEVKIVDWISSNTYVNPVRRYTGSDEIVVTDSQGNSVPAYGAVQAQYAVSYKVFSVTFEYDESKTRFKQIYMVAYNGTETATLQISPPQTRGTY